MEIEVDMQWKYFLWSVLVGVLMGVLYDMIRLRRKVKTGSDIWINIEDILFIFLTGVSLFLTAYFKNEGLLRWHGFIGEGLGFITYKLIVGDIVISGAYIALGIFKRIFAFLKRILFTPFMVVIKLLLRPFLLLSGMLKKILKVWKMRLKNTVNILSKK